MEFVIPLLITNYMSMRNFGKPYGYLRSDGNTNADWLEVFPLFLSIFCIGPYIAVVVLAHQGLGAAKKNEFITGSGIGTFVLVNGYTVILFNSGLATPYTPRKEPPLRVALLLSGYIDNPLFLFYHPGDIGHLITLTEVDQAHALSVAADHRDRAHRLTISDPVLGDQDQIVIVKHLFDRNHLTVSFVRFDIDDPLTTPVGDTVVINWRAFTKTVFSDHHKR